MNKVLVLIQLDGGNDALNTVIPLDQYATYKAARPTLAIPESKVLKLTDAVGLHPSLTGFQSMFAEGKLSIIQGVGIDKFNLSHFRQSDIVHSASNPDEIWSHGWLGRMFEQYYPASTHPSGIKIGTTPILSLQGQTSQHAMTLESDKALYDFNDGTQALSGTAGGLTLGFVRNVRRATEVYSAEIKKAGSLVTQQVDYPQDHPDFGEQLKTVARLIAGGLQTKVYVVTLDGFDTHSSQASGIDPTVGHHAQRLKFLNDAVTAFMKDLDFLGVADRVVCMTYSEFGRASQQNGSNGTDHGNAGMSFVFGKNLDTQKIWGKFDMTQKEMKEVYDLRQMYAEVLKWMDADPLKVLNRSFDAIPFLNLTTPPTRRIVAQLWEEGTVRGWDYL